MVLDDQYGDQYYNSPWSEVTSNRWRSYSGASHACMLQSLSKYKWAWVYCDVLEMQDGKLPEEIGLRSLNKPLKEVKKTNTQKFSSRHIDSKRCHAHDTHRHILIYVCLQVGSFYGFTRYPLHHHFWQEVWQQTSKSPFHTSWRARPPSEGPPGSTAAPKKTTTKKKQHGVSASSLSTGL